jgi:hypothetical protein
MRPQSGSQPLPVNYKHQSDIAQALSILAREMFAGTIQSEVEFVQKDYIFFALADKSLTTFEAIQVLCERLLVDDSFALARTLIESVINGTYVSLMNDQIAADYADYTDYRDWIEFDRLREVASEITSTVPADDVEEMRRKWELTRARYDGKRGDWCTQNLFRRACAIDSRIGPEYNLMRTLVNLPWRKACAHVHGTVASIHSRVRQSDSGVVIRRIVEPREAAGLLYIANMAIFALLALVDIRLGRARERDWRSLYQRWHQPVEDSSSSS